VADLPTYEFSDEGMRKALKALGETGADVAAKLKRLGFGGRRNLCKVCPVANYLLAVIEGAEDVEVHNECCHAIRRVVDYVDVEAEQVTAETPLAVAVFVENFDNGYHPELDSEVRGATA
jgi:hypothetical protein